MFALRERNSQILHWAIVYSDWKDRNRLIDSALRLAEGQFDALAILTCDPNTDKAYFSRWARERLRGRLPPLIFDANRILESGSDWSDQVTATGRKALNHFPELAVLFVGDWHHLCYDHPEIFLEQEAKKLDGLPARICCYRAEGFWSLKPEQICEAIHDHKRVLVNSTILNMEGPIVPQTMGNLAA